MTFSVLQALQSYGMGQQAARRRHDEQRQLAIREAQADFVLSGAGGPTFSSAAQLANSGQPALSTLGGMAQTTPADAALSLPSRLVEVGQQAVAQPSPREAAFRRLATLDPGSALAMRRQMTQAQDDELELETELNAAALQLVSGVYDQSSYETAMARARDLFGRLGRDTSGLDQLPAQYSPELINQVRMELMSGREQLDALRADRRLDWDIQDDQIDNERADRSTDSLIDYRQGQLENTRRGQDLTHQRGLRGQDISSRDRRRGQDMADERGRRGQDMTDARGRRGQDMRGSGSGGRAGGRSMGSAPIAVNPQTGQRLQFRNGQWVPIS